jgi:hypothetical protein
LWRLDLWLSFQIVGTGAFYAEIPARVVEEGHGLSGGVRRVNAGDVEIVVAGRMQVDDGALEGRYGIRQ